MKVRSLPDPVLTGLLAAVGCALGCAAGCSSGSGAAGSTPSTSHEVAVLPGGSAESSPGRSASGSASDSRARTTSVRATPARTTPARTTPATSVRPTPGKVREKTGACPYISANDEQIAEGKKVGRTTVLSRSPLGCRFYLAYPDYHAVTQITVRKYPSEISAFNTVARTGGSSAQSTPGIGDGAVLYRTNFYRPDGNRDWACIFAKGRTVVTVHTDATMSSADARNVAVAIVGKF
jgi:hypothetical protein